MVVSADIAEDGTFTGTAGTDVITGTEADETFKGYAGADNIGGGPANTISLLDLIALLKEEVSPAIPLSYAEWRPGDQPVYVSDISKAESELGWRPGRSAWPAALGATIDWYRANRTQAESRRN